MSALGCADVAPGLSEGRLAHVLADLPLGQLGGLREAGDRLLRISGQHVRITGAMGELARGLDSAMSYLDRMTVAVDPSRPGADPQPVQGDGEPPTGPAPALARDA